MSEAGAGRAVAAPRTALIVALTRSGLMGRELDLPWSWPEDLRHFQRATRGHVVVMGRRTWDSLKQQFGGPLKRRTNVVVSRSQGGPSPDGREADGARWFRTLPEALAWAGRQPALPAPGEPCPPPEPGTPVPEGDPSEVWILGGAEVFRLALEALDPPPARVVVTWVPDVPERSADTFFPWRPPEPRLLRDYAVAREWSGADGALRFVVYERRP